MKSGAQSRVHFRKLKRWPQSHLNSFEFATILMMIRLPQFGGGFKVSHLNKLLGANTLHIRLAMGPACLVVQITRPVEFGYKPFFFSGLLS